MSIFLLAGIFEKIIYIDYQKYLQSEDLFRKLFFSYLHLFLFSPIYILKSTLTVITGVDTSFIFSSLQNGSPGL